VSAPVLQELIALGLTLSSSLMASSICATVKDISGRPVRSASIVAVNLLAPTSQFSTTVSPSGKACLERLPEGLYSVEAASPGLGHLKVKYYPVRVTYPDDVTLSFDLPIGEITEGLGLSEATLSGTLIRDGSPVESVRLCLFQGDRPSPVSCTVTNDLGQYALVVTPGVYRIEVNPREGKTKKQQIDLSQPGYYRNLVSLPTQLEQEKR
jgi:hypothetical protein